MNKWKFGTVVVAACLAGCASAPEQLSASVVPGSATPSAVDGEPSEVTLEDISLDPGSLVVCRDMLKQGSNVITTTCMSRNDWKRYERRRAEEAAAIVRMLQGGAYR